MVDVLVAIAAWSAVVVTGTALVAGLVWLNAKTGGYLGWLLMLFA